MQYRDRHDVLKELLHATIDSLSPTRIMYDCHLSWAQMQAYTALALRKNLIQRLANGQYLITNEGKAVLKLLDELHLILGDLVDD